MSIGISAAIMGSAALGAGASIYGTSRANRLNQQLGQQQREHELRMWHMTNEYNSPAAQMQRLKDAGLNPHLVHGSADQADVPRQTPNEPVEDPFSSVMPALQLIQQVRAGNSEIAKTQAEIAYIQGNTANQDIVRRDYELRQQASHFDQYLKEEQRRLEERKFSHQVDMSQYQRDLQRAQTRQYLSRAELFLEQAASSRALTPVQVAKLRQDIRFNADLHEYNLQFNRSRATIESYKASDHMLQLLQDELTAKILQATSAADKNDQRRILGIDVHRDNILNQLFGASRGWSEYIRRRGSKR